jgi:hypothetical protein
MKIRNISSEQRWSSPIEKEPEANALQRRSPVVDAAQEPDNRCQVQ